MESCLLRGGCGLEELAEAVMSLGREEVGLGAGAVVLVTVVCAGGGGGGGGG